MQYENVKARCLFCEAIIEGHQADMAGWWESPDDLTPRWKSNGQPVRRSLWYGAGSPEKFQDFYLCSKHNDPHYYHAAMKWATEQLERGEYVNFTAPEPTLPTLELKERWEERRLSLPDKVPSTNEMANGEKLPNIWQLGDGRLEGCLEVSWAITDIFDATRSSVLLDYLELPDFPKPLELAEAMKKASKNIELLTDPEK